MMESSACFYPWQYKHRDRLVGLFKADKLPHALLLSGPAFLGKRDFAFALAGVLLCRDPVAGELCRQCPECHLFDAGTHPDFRVIEPEESKSIVIDQIRELIEWVSQTSQRGGLKVVVLYPAEQMNVHAANALLKCLEEPTDRTLLMLVSDLPGRLLPTIRSRCQHVGFAIPKTGDALDWLRSKRPDLDDPEVLLGIAGGAPLAVQRRYDEDFLSRRAAAVKAVGRLIEGTNPLEVAERLCKLDAVMALELLHGLFTDALRYALSGEENLIKNNDIKDLIKVICAKFSVGDLLAAMDAIGREQQALGGPSNPNAQLLMEALLVELAGFCAL